MRKCGIGFSNGLGKLRTEATDFPLEIFFLRDDDIPDYVADGVADVGIVGDLTRLHDRMPRAAIARAFMTPEAMRGLPQFDAVLCLRCSIT